MPQSYDDTDDIYYQREGFYDIEDPHAIDVSSARQVPEDYIYNANASYFQKPQRGPFRHQNQRQNGSQNQFRPYQPNRGYRPQFNKEQHVGNIRPQPYFNQQHFNGQHPSRNHATEQNKKIRQCYICGKDDHCFRDCPYNTFPQAQNNSGSKATFFKSDFALDEQESTFLIGETTNKALLDTGASSTVCGRTWFTVYEESLTDKEKAEILSEDGVKSFKFGDGKAVTASEKKTIPITLCGNDILLEVHIVENDIPLLLSRESMKRMKLIIDMEADKVYMGKGEENLQITKSGHVVIPISRCADKFPSHQQEIDSTFYVNPSDSKKCASHLHRYFAHSSANKLKSFIKSANLPNEDEIVAVLEDLDRTCEFCLKHKSKVKSHNKVAIPQGTVFNEVVAMDLKKLNCGVWIVHFIDTVTRFSAAASITNKSAEEILTKTFMRWISIFGRPQTFMSDNGGEFINYEFSNMCSLLNINIQTSPAEAPWCNGTVERHNGLLAQMIEAIMDDTGCNVDTAIAWAMNAKNSLGNNHGFSSYQLVIGRNPEVPDILSYNNLPALNSYTASQITADHLNAMESARRKYIELENNERFKRVLRERVSEDADTKYISGDTVYFKRDQKGWQGPATVVGHISNQVILKHGGMLIRMHPCKVVLKSRADNEVEKSTSVDIMDNDQGPIKDHERPTNDDERQSKLRHRERTPSSSSSDSDNSDNGSLQPQQENKEELSAESRPNITSSKEISASSSTNNLQTDQLIPEHTGTDWTTVSSHGNTSKVSLNKGDVIRYREAESDTWERGLIMSRAGKANGKYKNCFNILKDGNQDQTQVNVDNVALEKLDPEAKEQIMLIDEDSEILVLKSSEDPKVTKAKQDELQKFKEFNVYKEVKDVGQSTISTRWVITNKGDNIKARLVARGFEELSFIQCDAPTVTKPCLRMAFIIASSNGWKIESLDITSAFLQSDKLLREVYIKPPADIRTTGIIWLLNKPLYGLGESARLWYFTLKKQVTELGCKMSILDKSVFLYFGSGGKLQGIIVTHVDDLLFCGTSNFRREVIQPILNKFKISRLKISIFTYLGWSVHQKEDHISVDQNDYSKLIKPALLSPSRKKALDDNLTEEEHKQYQSLLGKLLWLSSQSRPDLCYDTMEHSTLGKNPKVKDLLSLNKVTKKIDQGNAKTLFRAMNLEKDKLQIVFYSDASLGNLPNKKSSGRGYIVFLTNGTIANAITWSSNKVKRVVHSVFGAETLGCIDGAAAAINVRQQLSEILYNNPRSDIIPIIGLVDSRQLTDHITSTKQCEDKRIRLDIAELQESVSIGEIDRITWIPTTDMLADCLTKKSACCKKLCESLESGYIEGLENHLNL